MSPQVLPNRKGIEDIQEPYILYYMGYSGRRDKMTEIEDAFSRLPYKFVVANAGNFILPTRIKCVPEQFFAWRPHG
jgi:hypothetical protein